MSQKGWPSAQVTVAPARFFLLRVRFGSTCHSKAQACGPLVAVQEPGAGSVHVGAGSVQAALATQPPARFDQREFTVNVSFPTGRSTRQPRLSQRSAFSA